MHRGSAEAQSEVTDTAICQMRIQGTLGQVPPRFWQLHGVSATRSTLGWKVVDR